MRLKTEKTQNMHFLIKTVNYANIGKINFQYFEYKHHEIDFYTRMEAIGQPKKKRAKS